MCRVDTEAEDCTWPRARSRASTRGAVSLTWAVEQLLQALRRSAIFQIGAQWIASKGAILRLRRCGALQSWIANIRAAAAAANAEPSDAPGYSFSACCDAPPSGNVRSCHPWRARRLGAAARPSPRREACNFDTL